MDNETLKAIAEAILTSIEGEGMWRRDGEMGFKKIEDPLTGLSVGDVVFRYSEDDEAILEQRVIVVVDGVGYVHGVSFSGKPILLAVSESLYSRTIEDCIEEWREVIDSDVEYMENRSERLAALKATLAKHGG